jgi:hypothetical protein
MVDCPGIRKVKIIVEKLRVAKHTQKAQLVYVSCSTSVGAAATTAAVVVIVVALAVAHEQHVHCL